MVIINWGIIEYVLYELREWDMVDRLWFYINSELLELQCWNMVVVDWSFTSDLVCHLQCWDMVIDRRIQVVECLCWMQRRAVVNKVWCHFAYSMF